MINFQGWLSAFAVASQFRMEKRRNVDVFCRIKITGMSLEFLSFIGVILVQICRKYCKN